MKKIILIISLILIASGLFGQTQLKKGLIVGDAADTVIISKITIDGDNLIKIYQGTTQRYMYGQLKIADTASMLTKYARKASPTFTGTVTLPSGTSIGDVSSTEIGYVNGVTSAIQTQINGKLNISDTAAMLVPYINRVDTSGMLTPYINRVDTATMLTPYARKASPTFTGVPKISTDTIATRAYARSYGGTGASYAWIDSANYYTNVLNVLDFGAVSDDSQNDADNIRAAITAAVAGSVQNDPDGRPIPLSVYIPNGSWYITDSIPLVSHLNLIIDKNAYFEVPTGYYGSIFYSDGLLFNCHVSGGYYFQWPGLKYTAVKIISPSSTYWAMNNSFTDMTIRLPKHGIHLEVKTNGYINWNSFERIKIWHPTVGVKMRESVASLGMDGNSFSDCGVQFISSGVTTGIDTVSGLYNVFDNWESWDLGAGTGETHVSVVVTGNYNQFKSGILGDPATYVFNTGLYNYIEYRGMNGQPYQEPIKYSGLYADRETVAKININGNTINGTTGSPAGDIGIKIKSGGTGTLTYEDTRSIRVIARNQASADNGGYGALQAYNGTSAYVDAMKWDRNGDATFYDQVTAPKLLVGDATSNTVITIDSIGYVGTEYGVYDGATKVNPSGFSTLATRQNINDSIDLYLSNADELSDLAPLLVDTIPLFTFGLGGGLSADTAVFNDNTLAGAFYNEGSDTLAVTQLMGVLAEGTGTETVSVQVSWHTTMKSGSATNLNAAALAITSITTGTVDTSFANSKIPPNVFVWCTISGVSAGNRPSFLSVTISGYKIPKY